MESTLDYRIYKSYQVQKKIGKGAYGEVFKALDKKTLKGVAIKKINDAFQNLTDAKRTYRQLAYLLQLSHPCIIKLQRVMSAEVLANHQVSPNKNVYAIFELMEMDLSKTLQYCKLQPLQRKFIGLQILCGLNYLHKSGLVHRDIKPSNILVDQECHAKICDFGLVRKISDFTQRSNTQQIFTEYVASRWYRAPEILLNGTQLSTSQIDMWSFGCVLGQMILGCPLFEGKNTLDQLEQIFRATGMPVESQIENIGTEEGKFLLRNFHQIKRCDIDQILINGTPEEIDLIQNLLVFNPEKRLSAAQALKHPFFDELNSELHLFIEPPVKIYDNAQHLHSQSDSAKSLERYRELIQSLCVNTFRTSNNSSSKRLTNDQAYYQHQYKQYLKKKQQPLINLQQQFKVFGTMGPVNQQKSTRESNCDKKQKKKVVTVSDRSQSKQSLIYNPKQIAKPFGKMSTHKPKQRSRSKNKIETPNKSFSSKNLTHKQAQKATKNNSQTKQKSRLNLNTPKSKSKHKRTLQKSTSSIFPLHMQPKGSSKVAEKYQIEANVGTNKLLKKKKK